MSLKNAQRSVQQLYDNLHTSSFPTGFDAWDQLTGGLVRGGLTMISARPGMGKTSLALNVISRLSRKITGSILVVSAQSPERELAVRLLQIGTGMRAEKFLDGSLSPAEAGGLCSRFLEKQTCKIKVRYETNPTLKNISDACRRIEDLQLVVVDDAAYISEPLQPWDVNPFPRQEPLSDIADSLRQLAQNLNVAMVCITGLHRSLERRKDRHPKLKDLERMGALPQQADQVVFLYRKRYYNFEADDTAECTVAKTAYGQTGTFRLVWDYETGSFSELPIK